jgi:hypothetical protein
MPSSKCRHHTHQEPTLGRQIVELGRSSSGQLSQRYTYGKWEMVQQTLLQSFFLSNAAKVSAVEITGFYQTVLGVRCNGMYHVEGIQDETVFCTSLFQTNWSSKQSLMQHYVIAQKECIAGMVIWYCSKLRGRCPRQFLKHCFGIHVNRPLWRSKG